MTLRILTFAHGSARLTAGGAERAALSLHQWLQRDPDVESILIARADPAALGHGAHFAAFRGNHAELLAHVPGQDQFSLQSMNFTLLERMIDDLLDRFAPDVVHVQHFQNWSLDLLALLERRAVPVVMTLHEYLLICHNNGQMIKTTGELCYAASASECGRCFPDRTAGEFFMRREMILERLASVAAFISPSQFLADRFIAWGIAPERIRVIDNPLSPELLDRVAQMPDSDRPTDGKTSFGFFGQLNRYKGVLTLLEAVGLLPNSVRKKIRVGIHGANLAFESEDFQKSFADLCEQAGTAIRLFPAYNNADAVELMRLYDWIAVPSVWWENSPVVIQEAMIAGRPLLCSGIGGMAEKLESAGGVSFRPGDAVDLAAKIADIVENPQGVTAVARGADDHIARVTAHLELFQHLAAR